MTGSRPFTPQREPVAALAARTVDRAALLEALRAKFAAAASSAARPHVLLVGPPGAGKTHLLELALADLDERLLLVRIPEGAIGVTRYQDLPAAVLRALDPTAGPGPSEARIAKRLDGRTVLLVVEQLDRVFNDIGLSGQRALRAWVETSGAIMVLGTADRVFRGMLQREQPWFGGMAVFVLPDLTPEEGRDLASRVARERGNRALAEYLRTPAGLARAQGIAALTGGTARVWTLLAATTKQRLDALLPAVEDVLEALVGVHDLRLLSLSPNERRLLAAIAATPGAATVSDLAAAADIEQRTAAAALGRLADADWVTASKPAAGDRRTTYYRIRDPLIRQHLLYRAGDPRLAATVEALRAFHAGEHPSPDAAPLAALIAAAAHDERAALALPPELQPLVAAAQPQVQ